MLKVFPESWILTTQKNTFWGRKLCSPTLLRHRRKLFLQERPRTSFEVSLYSGKQVYSLGFQNPFRRFCYHHLNISRKGKEWSLRSFSETNQHLISPLTSTSTFSSNVGRFYLVEESWVEICYIFSLLCCLNWSLSGSLRIYTFTQNMKLSWIVQTHFPTWGGQCGSHLNSEKD